MVHFDLSPLSVIAPRHIFLIYAYSVIGLRLNVLFLFIDQHNYNQPPISLREPTCRKSTLPQATLGIAEAILFLNERR